MTSSAGISCIPNIFANFSEYIKQNNSKADLPLSEDFLALLMCEKIVFRSSCVRSSKEVSLGKIFLSCV